MEVGGPRLGKPRGSRSNEEGARRSEDARQGDEGKRATASEDSAE